MNFSYTDENNILSISPNNPDLLNNLTSVQISVHYEKSDVPSKPISFKLDLEKIINADGEELYITEPFQPPRQPFKIDVRIHIMNKTEFLPPFYFFILKTMYTII